ncbi:MAG: DNA repair protein RadA [Lachnospiraceae bacterium]|nr:DNA repair protein RadA [Lachnospiraceae bacterium]
MAKEKMKSVFFCQECGYESAKWMGQCPACRAWNSFAEETVSAQKNSKEAKSNTAGPKSRPAVLNEISMEEESRIPTHIEELDRVLGGGIVSGSLTLVGGDPGIGKSTLLLQMCQKLAADQKKVLYISGEESLRQIKMRAQRIGRFTDSLQLYCETNLTDIESVIVNQRPQVVIIDSIQTMFNENVSAAPGSVSQVRESTGVLLRLAKVYGSSIFIVGHVTKEGTVAGPRVLEHMVDTVLYFEGDRHASYRILRGVKNRFGSTNEIGVFEMRQEGLVEVKNPSEYMLNGRPEGASGSVVSCSMEGTRPILTEIQALVCHSNFGIPRRQTTGTDFNRVNLLMAVLEKRLGMQIGSCDAYVNIAGGIKITEPAIDLGIVMAIMSSFKNRPVPEGVIAFGEVGLSGEVRAVSMAQIRVQEAKKLGFTTCILPKVCLDNMQKIDGIRLVGVRSLADVAGQF